MNTQQSCGSGFGRSSLVGLAAAAMALLAAPAQSTETTEEVGALAMPASRERGSARAVAMQATYVGIAQGAEALQWNPAGLGRLSQAELSGHHASGLDGAIGETVIVGLPLGAIGGLAASADYADAGSFETRDSVGNLTGHHGASAGSVGLGYGVALPLDLAIGAAVKGTRQTLAQVAYTACAVDAGALWTGMSPLAVGVAVANLGTSGSGSELAWGIRAGASYTLALGTRQRLVGAAAADLEPGGLSRFNLGVEDTLFGRLAIRAGYRMNFADQQLDGLTGLTVGVGVAVNRLAVDYAFQPSGELGNIQRVSLTYRVAVQARTEAAAEGGAQ